MNWGSSISKKGSYDQAFQEFQRTASLNPDYAPARAAVGEGYLHQGKPEEAVKELNAPWSSTRNPGGRDTVWAAPTKR